MIYLINRLATLVLIMSLLLVEIFLFTFISGFYGNKGGSSPKWKHDKYEEVVQMEEPSSTTDN